MSKTKDNAIFIHRILYTIASSTIKVFLPIIVYNQTNNIELAMLFALLQYVSGGIFSAVLRKFLAKHQLLSMLISIVPFIIIQFIISFFILNLLTVIMLAILAGITIPLYYVPLNIHFTLQDDKHNVAKFETGAILGNIAFILLNGYILGANFRNSLLLISIFSFILFLLSGIPLLANYKKLNKEVLQDKTGDILKANKILKNQNLFHMFLGLFLHATTTVLPLYLVYKNLSIESVAYVVALTEVFKIITNYIANYFKAQNLDVLNYIIGCTSLIIISIILVFSKSQELLFIISILLGITFPFIFVPSFGNYCKVIKRENIVADGLILREFYLLNIRGIIFPIFFIVPSFTIIFLISALSGVGMFITRINYNKNK